MSVVAKKAQEKCFLGDSPPSGRGQLKIFCVAPPFIGVPAAAKDFKTISQYINNLGEGRSSEQYGPIISWKSIVKEEGRAF